MAVETFRTQLPSYLSSNNPPDVYTWYAGSVARQFAKKGELLDLSHVWESSLSNYSPALKSLCTDTNGKQIFVPRNYYYWGVWYRKSMFAQWGVEVPATWTKFLDVCKKIQTKGVPAVGTGHQGTNAWILAGWFDYLNMRINGPDYHVKLLAGADSFDSPKVTTVFDTWKQAMPYFDPKGAATDYNLTFTQLAQGKVGMTLAGSYILGALPENVLGDIDFFQFPIIDPSVPVGEEAPTDGVFASARTQNSRTVEAFCSFIARPEVQRDWIAVAGGGNLPCNPGAPIADDVHTKKGKDMLERAGALTQFFNRDSSDGLQETANAALAEFLAKPNDAKRIQSTWEDAAKRVFTS
ncbi:multiple sugar transport system substrate-binding protein [Kribbella aluminosa]|uniref:Multiple sugar transport system substrate-binding protein n=1 Tax=Kribbella aluminosa TaxID=416017 RepID=A0ABS4UWL8_9ACTN|nr:multiple sugar transport system substrate-binding protein [Kribbella aluminosa]